MSEEDDDPKADGRPRMKKLPKKLYEKELHRLQVELVAMAEWVKH